MHVLVAGIVVGFVPSTVAVSTRRTFPPGWPALLVLMRKLLPHVLQDPAPSTSIPGDFSNTQKQRRISRMKKGCQKKQKQIYHVTNITKWDCFFPTLSGNKKRDQNDLTFGN